MRHYSLTLPALFASFVAILAPSISAKADSWSVGDFASATKPNTASFLSNLRQGDRVLMSKGGVFAAIKKKGLPRVNLLNQDGTFSMFRVSRDAVLELIDDRGTFVTREATSKSAVHRVRNQAGVARYRDYAGSNYTPEIILPSGALIMSDVQSVSHVPSRVALYAAQPKPLKPARIDVPSVAGPSVISEVFELPSGGIIFAVDTNFYTSTPTVNVYLYSPTSETTKLTSLSSSTDVPGYTHDLPTPIGAFSDTEFVTASTGTSATVNTVDRDTGTVLTALTLPSAVVGRFSTCYGTCFSSINGLVTHPSLAQLSFDFLDSRSIVQIGFGSDGSVFFLEVSGKRMLLRRARATS